ncbi:MAG: glycosyltransferase family 1 protein [Eubacterium sp.]
MKTDRKSEHGPLRIAVVAPLGVGGITGLMLNIQRHIDRDKINFDYLVFHNRHEPQEDEAIALGSKKIIASTDNIKFRPLRGFCRLFVLAKVCKENDIKILHFNCGAPKVLLMIIAARMGGVKYVTYHSHNSGMSNEGRWVSLINKLCKPFIPFFADDFWACSTLAAKFTFPKSIVDNNKFYFMPNGINLNRFVYDKEIRNKLRKELGYEGKFVVGHAGRFTYQKNHSYLIDIFNEIHKKDLTAVLVLCGEGELQEQIKDKVYKLGLEGFVTFLGASDEMQNIYNVMDVFIMPSHYEGLPVAGVEAQASGLPVVFANTITREVGVTENISYISLSEPPHKWAETVLSYKNVERRDNREELKNAGFDQESMVEHFQNYYFEVGRKLNLI